MPYSFHVYIITNSTKTVLYTGFTNNLQQRLAEHFMNKGTNKSFTGKYYCYYLLFHEHHKYVNNAIAREKEIKGWVRAKKLKLIREFNPTMKFLNNEIMDWPQKNPYHR